MERFNPENVVLTYREAADLIGVPMASLRGYVHRRQVPFLRIAPRTIRFPKASLERWLKEKLVSPSVGRDSRERRHGSR